jgi:hypothetical protein
MAGDMLAEGGSYFATTLVFMMNVQLGQICYDRNIVDHSCAIAVDVAKKTYCAKQGSTQAAEAAARKAVDAVMQTTGANQQCNFTITPTGIEEDPGAQGLDVKVDCDFTCMVPVGSQVMCNAGMVHFEAKASTVAMGCDGQGVTDV